MTDPELIEETRLRYGKPPSWDCSDNLRHWSSHRLILTLADRLEARTKVTEEMVEEATTALLLKYWGLSRRRLTVAVRAALEAALGTEGGK